LTEVEFKGLQSHKLARLALSKQTYEIEVEVEVEVDVETEIVLGVEP